MSKKALFGSLLFLFGSASPLPGRGCHSTAEIFRKVEIPGTTVLQALFRFAAEHGVCLGIELAGEEILRRRAEVDMEAASALEAVRAVLEAAEYYEAVERDGLILIRDRRVRGFTLLDYRLEAFEVPRAPLQAVGNALRMSLIRLVRPEVTGFAGHYRPGGVAGIVGPFREKDKTVRELLNLIVTASQGGVWMARGGEIDEGTLPRGPYWEIFPFGSGREPEPAVLLAAAEKLIQ